MDDTKVSNGNTAMPKDDTCGPEKEKWPNIDKATLKHMQKTDPTLEAV